MILRRERSLKNNVYFTKTSFVAYGRKDESGVIDQKNAAEEANAPEAAPNAAAGSTVVEISKIARPGVALSGTVKFANGSTADWFLDQTGRLGLDNLVGENPSKDDVIAFQQELQRQLGA